MAKPGEQVSEETKRLLLAQRVGDLERLVQSLARRLQEAEDEQMRLEVRCEELEEYVGLKWTSPEPNPAASGGGALPRGGGVSGVEERCNER